MTARKQGGRRGNGRNLALLAAMQGRRLLVLGDLIADEYLYGEAARISREAPVLILRHQGRAVVPGGASNTARNVQAVGGEAILLGVVGGDSQGEELLGELARAGLSTQGIVVDPGRPTTVKTRVLAGGNQAVKQQVVRIDRFVQEPVTGETEAQLLVRLEEYLPQCDGIIISDYGLGVVTPTLWQWVREKTRELNAGPVAVDSRYNLQDFVGATILTPNLAEAAAALGRDLTNETEIYRAGRELVQRLQAEAVLLTRGEEGMTLFEAGGRIVHVPATEPTEVFDVTGAGDTVIGIFTLALAAGADCAEAAVLANLAAGLVVRKLGTAATTRAELERALIEGLARLPVYPVSPAL